ncbi:MAG: ATP-dependent DNA helicase [Candidatus Thermoplasmatota archaeon]|uniref:DNA 5'-3' helicase n=3 Tax=Candidatus Sysuiplasma superficiale TaxID=2823368 RepID=A0A8J7YNF6_9ARCH|nr:ATP-dependent DNA helicase [Candidatus Sysuiplasma superficiale]MCL4346565.1 ATP-dependent DNA helicase [Candidatus Thermoplasmatota archaeon]
MMKAVFDALSQGRHLILESPTGSGKTASVLSSIIENAGNRKILYLTRTNSQQRQVMIELRKLTARRKVFAIAIQGRNSSCLLARGSEEMRTGSAEELSSYCARLKDLTRSGLEGCRYYSGLMLADQAELLDWMRRKLPDAEEAIDFGADRGICPYELSKSFMSDADLVVAPYIYFFDPFIRRRLLEWMGTQPGNLIIVLDEAHNLPDYLREVESIRFSLRAVQGMKKEAEEFGDPEVISGVSVRDLAEILERVIRTISDEFVLDEDGIVPEDELETQIMEELGVSSRSFHVISAVLSNQGDVVRDAKLKEGKLPRSYIRSFSDFLRFWVEVEPQHYVKLVNGGENPSLEAYCLDPAIAASPLMEASTTIHMSGTLGRLEDYRALLQLPEDTIMLSLPSDFPPENRRIVYVDDITTRYEVLARDAAMLSSICTRIVDICNRVRRNTIVFFPSFGLLESLLDLGIERKMASSVLIERRDMRQEELMHAVERFKNSKDAVFLSVIGGRISEGLDFPEKSLEMVIIVGIPYPRPTAKQRALVNYYDILYGKGWDYAVRGPALRRLLQAAGRMIRSETDRGIAIVLDKRMSYFSGIEAERVEDAAEAAASFFSIKNCENG